MVRENPTFKAADIAQRFKSSCIQFDTLLASEKSQELTKIRQKLHDGLKEYKQQGALTVAFVGQYSAGKSTIISALTGRRDIYIDADIATDKMAFYDWNGIKIVDTPGLFTDREDHDDVTYGAIEKADLLVFCLTHMLFDSVTIENFKKLAYNKGYRWKILLLINKMSASAGEDIQKISSYSHSLSEALKPYNLAEFQTCFIDAKDFCDGIDDAEDFLIESSRFDGFIGELNQFVERRSSLVRLDTPVRIVLGCIDDAQIGFARNSDEDTTFLEVLLRLSRRINKERERLRTRVKSIMLEMSAAIIAEGTNLASVVGDKEFEDLNKRSEINVRKHYEKAGKALEGVIETAIHSVQNEIETELQSNLTQAFVAQINFDQKINVAIPNQKFNSQQIGQQVAWLTGIAEKAGIQLAASSTRGFISTAKSGQAFLRPMDVAGSATHGFVLEAGKVIGFKFKPWQAVGIAKNIGNAAMFLGPALAVISIGTEIIGMHQEHEHERKMADVRRDITSQFKAIAVDLEQQIEGQLHEFEIQVYGQLEENISKARQQTETAMTTSNTELEQLAAVRHKFELILQDIQRAAKPSIL